MSLMQNTVVMNKLSKCIELVFGCDINLPFSILLNAIMIDSPVITQANASLTRRAFTFAHQEATIDTGTEKILSSVS